MKRVVMVLIVIVAVVIVVTAFYRGWVGMTSDSGDQKSNVTFSLDADKFQADRKTAMAGAQDLGRQIKDKISGPSAKSMEGKVVNVAGDQLTMTNAEGKEHSHALAANVKITCDGRDCMAADLKAGMRIRVTTDDAAPHAASRIEALDKDAAFASRSHDGKVVSITGEKLVMTNGDGKEEQTCTLTAGVKVTCDGEVCKTADLKPGMRIRVTSDGADARAATRIEALDKNPDFAKVG